MENVHELLGYEKIKIIQRDDMLRFSLDSMLLADFIDTSKLKDAEEIIDLGCGNAPIPLFLTLKTKAKIIGVDVQCDVCDVARRSVTLNNLESQIEIVNSNIKDIYKVLGANRFSIASTNPPYFKYKETSRINKNDYLTIARHEVLITLEEIISEAKKLLIDGGSFYMVHRAERISDIITCLEKEKFGLKKLRFVYSKENDENALLILIHARKNKPSDVKIVKPLYVYDKSGSYTEEVKNIFNFK